MYEPLAAFHEPHRSRWAAYAASQRRPRRQEALAAELRHAVRQMITVPRPDAEPSGHAYVRRDEQGVYICPWQSWPSPSSAAAGPARSHIRARRWSVPMAWFVPFAGEERWVATGAAAGAQGGIDVRAGRALVYITPMCQARRRLARGLTVIRNIRVCQDMPERLPAEAELASLGRWLEQFHPTSLVELDYGGLVYLFSDDALRADESVAEVAATLDAIVRDRKEVAAAMAARVRRRWREFQAFEQVN